MMAWRAMTLLHARMKHVAVLVPQVAYSAATMLAMGAHEIVMHPHGNLGPVDPQIEVSQPGEAGQPGQRQRFGFEDLAGFLEFAKKEVGLTDQEHVRHMFEMFCKQVGPVPVAVAARAALLTVTMGEKLLRLHMGEDVQKARSIAETLNKSFFDHGYPVSRREAKDDIKLPISEANEQVEDLMWRIWLDIEEELKARKPFNPLGEALSNPEVANQLLRTVSQPIMPPTSQVAQHIIQNFQIPQVSAGSKAVLPGLGDFFKELFNSSVVDVPPTDFELLTAIMESTRTASRERAKGKILACRMPDLTFRASLAMTSAGWERVEIQQTGPTPT
jgi:Serine dehydrogenase proteinase